MGYTILKDLLNEETFSLVEAELKDKDIKLVDLKTGDYVYKDKHDTQVNDLETKYETLVTDFNDYKKDNSTDKYTNLETKYNQALETINGYENKDSLSKLNISSDYTDFVLYKVNQEVTDEKDFETALNEFVEANPKYIGESKRVDTNPKLNNDVDSTNKSGTEKANDALRTLRQK